MPDAHANFAIGAVATAPSPATSGTSLTVGSGQGALFPLPPFNATVWATGATPTTANAEIVRVTGRATDTFTIVRAQEGSTARTIIATDQIMAAITAKTLTDLERAASSTQASSYTFVLGDANTVVESTSATAVNFTIPPNSSVAFPLGTVIEILQYGAGTITIVAGSGVTLRSNGSKVNSAAQYSTLGIRQRAANEWVLSGDLA